MIGGVNFQPGSQEEELRKRGAGTGVSGRTGSEGVQEAIKVLSLRLPKVIGAQGVAPSALLNASGGMGRPGVDSIVESVLAKFFPGGSGAAPGAQASAPSPFQGAVDSMRGAYGGAPSVPKPQGMQQPQQQYRPPSNFNPRVVVDPGWHAIPGEHTVGPDGRPSYGGGFPPAMIGELPPNTPPTPSAEPPKPPDLRPNFDWLPSPSPEQHYF